MVVLHYRTKNNIACIIYLEGLDTTLLQEYWPVRVICIGLSCCVQLEYIGLDTASLDAELAIFIQTDVCVACTKYIS